MSFRNIKWILRKQIEIGRDRKWTMHLDEDGKTLFTCLYHIVPKEADVVYTADELLKKLTNDY